MDALEAVLDEVALEGLDGITVPALWLRLQARVPPFPLLLDAPTKELIWQSLLRHQELDFYQLPEERKPLVIYNRYEEFQYDPSVLKPKADSRPEDIYPVHTILDNKNGIQGSCRFFEERVSVGEYLRKHLMTNEDAFAKWGEKLVIVGSQILRFRALIGWEGDPSLKLPDCSYLSLVDAGKVHYLRRVLDRKGLVTMQTHIIKLPSGAQQHSLLLLLKRFHVDRKNRYDTLAEKVSLLLSERENHLATLVNLREEMGLPDRLFKRLYYYMAAAGIVKTVSVPLQEIQPLAELCKTKRGTDIMVRCIKLVKEYKRKEGDEDEDEDEDDKDLKTTVVPIDIIYEKDMLTQTYELIESQGTNGISQSEIKLAMNVGKLEARMLCRLLERYKLIKLGKALSKLVELDKISVTSENNCSRDSLHLESNSFITTLDEDNDDISVIEEVVDKDMETKKGKGSSKSGTLEKSHETYRLLKRRNIIVETVKNLRLVESMFTVIGVKGFGEYGSLGKVEFVVHPSINPNDPLVKSTIEQIRFRMSNSTSGNRTRLPQTSPGSGKSEHDEQNKEHKGEKHKTSLFLGDSCEDLTDGKDSMDVTQLKNYHPVIVPGLGRTLGYLPKMPRLKITHIYLWYIVYGHPLHKAKQQKTPDSNPPSANTHHKDTEDVTDGRSKTDCPADLDTEKCTISASTEECTSNTEKEEKSEHVYVDEESWIRCVPPASLHSDLGPGWVIVSDILLCMPLSIFIQIVQVSYKVDNLEEYLNDPIKKHTLIRHLPRPMRQQLLYKRRYVFSVFQGLQKISCMGLVQFGPTEKFQEKDQVFVHVKKNATIVDTTVCDPHYNLAHASHPFEKRSYRLETFQDVENFWFDLQFVCLNTPLGVVRNPRGKKMNTSDHDNLPGQDMDAESEERQTLEKKCNILENIVGSKEVVDDGSIPGDGLGAGGLDSSFYGHLKRNWIWISYIVNNSRKTKYAQQGFTLRLQTFLNKPILLLGSKVQPERDFDDVNMSENGEFVEMVKESTVSRNKRVCGGRNRKRKKPKQQIEKKQKTKKKKEKTAEKMKRSRYHDEADQSALQRMTRLRVAWTAQEDGLLMLCRIGSTILNRKVNRPFVPWQVVRDIMHSSFEESLDKTSHSIGRRARYIMKNPQTYLNYKVCLAEVYQEKGLAKDFMNRKANYDDPKICAAEFKEFVDRLKVKFSSKMDDPAYEIPDTVEDLFNR
ncbi:general transcription factor 3C polypeptide 1 [Pyxicephalus adspersus]|uniref:general transcription factor 3C polypeptide 1 n=1 Tax=Pyxicephalus adspersus TaxID=30357 RepID=UPI003B599D3B